MTAIGVKTAGLRKTNLTMLKILTTYANKLGHHRTGGIFLSKHSNHVHVIRQCSFLVCYVCAEGSDPSQ